MVQFNDLQIQVLKNIYDRLDEDSKENFRCTNEKLYESFDSIKLNHIEKLNRNGCNLKKLPKELNYMKNINNLILDNNELNNIPDEIANINKLLFLSVRWNNINSISPEIGKLKNLTRLSLRENRISHLPDEIGELSSLTHIFLQSNEIKELPKSIGKLKLLHILNLEDNLIENIPKSLSKCKFLHTINLERNKISDLPKELFDLQNLCILNLNSNEISNIPKEIENSSSLQLLSLNDNTITTLPSELFSLKNLKSLYAKSNRINEIPKEVRNAVNLRILYLNTNDIQNIPEELMDTISLVELNLAENEIVGIPKNIMFLNKLTLLDLSYNKIEEIPVEVEELSNLETLNLNDNLITEIPFDIKNGKLNKLRNFNIKNNNITNTDELCIYAGTELETNTESEIPYIHNTAFNNIKPLYRSLNAKSKHCKRDSLGEHMFAEFCAPSECADSDITSVSNEYSYSNKNESEKLKTLREKIKILTENYHSMDENIKKNNEVFLNTLLKDADLLSLKNKESIDELVNKFKTDAQSEIDEIIKYNTLIKEELKKGNENISDLENKKEEAKNKINANKKQLSANVELIKEKNRKEEKKSKYDNDLIKNNFDPNMEFSFDPKELSKLLFGNYGIKTENSMPRMFILLPKAVSGLKKVFSFKKTKDKTKEPDFWANIDNWKETPQFQFHYICEYDGHEHIMETPYIYNIRNANKLIATTAAVLKFSVDCILNRINENPNYCKSLFEKCLSATSASKYLENISNTAATKIYTSKPEPVNYKQICHLIDSARYELKKIINEVDSSQKFGNLNKVVISKGCTRYMCKEHEEKYKKEGFGLGSEKGSKSSLSKSSKSSRSSRSTIDLASPKSPKSPKVKSSKSKSEDEPTSPKSPKSPKVKSSKSKSEDEPTSPKSPKPKSSRKSSKSLKTSSKSSLDSNSPKSPKSPKPRSSKSK